MYIDNFAFDAISKASPRWDEGIPPYRSFVCLHRNKNKL